MKSLTPNNNNKRGILKGTSVMSLLSKKVELKKELISLKKTKSQPKRQESLEEEIQKIETYLSKHKIQK
tara:strand:+ start:1486 stop:1692 length:207 start_codon:yes stop_codon:yes gene_type:complete